MSQQQTPQLNCGSCGYPTCDEFIDQLKNDPSILKRCIHMNVETICKVTESGCRGAQNSDACASCKGASQSTMPTTLSWKDSLDREFDFYLDHFPEDDGPKEIILPHNPMLTRELNVQIGDLMIGRPLGMSCGCPVTHCGTVTEVDQRTGVMTWCVTGPLSTRGKDFKDIGYYSAEGYEGMITDARCQIQIGMRYFFQPRRCMLQWRHSGMVNYVNKTKDGIHVRLEGLWIG